MSDSEKSDSDSESLHLEMAEARNVVSAIGEFSPNKEKWANYQRRFNAWMRINKIQDDEKIDAFISMVGPEVVDLLVALCAPAEIETKTYAQLTTLISNHYTSGSNELIESFKFDERKQTDSESVSDYIVALKKISIHCGFGDDDQVKKRLRNRLVTGLRSAAIKNRLLGVGAGLTWEKAVDISTSMDTASQGNQLMGPTHDVNRVQRGGYNKHKGKTHTKNKCYRCDGDHEGRCPYEKQKCFNCDRIGHIAKACKTKPAQGQSQSRGSSRPYRGRGRGRGQGQGRANYVDDDEKPEEEVSYASLYEVKSGKYGEITVNARVENNEMTFALDTASAVSIVGEDDYKEFFPDFELREASINLKSYTGHKVELLGEIDVHVEYEGQKRQLPLVIAKGVRTPLFGRTWLKAIRIDWDNVFAIYATPLEQLLHEYQSVFKGEIGEIKDFEATIELKPEATPKFQKARPIVYALTDGVKKELQRLEENGVYRRIERSEWASPIVVVPKDNGQMRLCGDYKVTINSSVVDQPYTLPTAEDIFATLAGGSQFTKLDLSNAYQQVVVEEKSRKYLTINTLQGLYEVTRLPYGIKTAPHIFQRIMDQVLQGIPGVCCYIDDILITAPTKEEHLKRLELVLQRLDKYDVRVKREKCSFLAPEVQYLGHVISKEGRRPVPDKVSAVKDTKAPESVPELRTFLGMINYYGGFVKNLSTILAPLNNLLRDDVPWKWSKECEGAFEKVKEALTSDTVLTHYDVNKKLLLATDASPYGVGAVLSHVDENGEERPIAYASVTLTKAERNYAQIEREALGIIFGVKKFHKYLYGRSFTLLTDHKPLTKILGPKTDVPTLAALRLQRWSLILMTYNYDVKYKRSEDHANADYLSRAPVDIAKENMEAEVNYFSHTDKLPIHARDIKEATRKDRILAKVLEFTMNGWPNHVDDDELLPFYTRRHELSCDQGCLLWGMRVIIPQKLQERMLEELHIEHVGIVRMKALARSYLWFPGIDNAIEALTKACKTCLSLKNDPPASPMYPWRYPERPWDRLHIDFAEYKSEMFLVVVDAHSKWLEVVLMKSTTAEKTRDVLEWMFAHNGFPREVVSDNGPQFIAEVFREFLHNKGIKHTLTAPYHPASNGLAERAVQTLKNALKRHTLDEKPGMTTQRKLCSFLLSYNSTPHSVTGVSPSELYLKRQLRTRLSMIKPDLHLAVEGKQDKMIQYRDQRVPKLREFSKGDRVRVKNCRGTDIKYVPGSIVYRKGPVQYLVRVGRNLRFVHVDHLRKSGETVEEDDIDDEQPRAIRNPISEMITDQPKSVITETPATATQEEVVPTPEPARVVPHQVVATPMTVPSPKRVAPSPRRMPTRDRRPPSKFNDYVPK